MRTESAPETWLRLSGGALPFRLQEGEGTVTVRVTGLTADGSLRLAVRGQAFTAAANGTWRPGDVFAARLRYSGSILYLDPLPRSPETPDASIFARLDLTETPVSAFLIRFFTISDYRLDPVLLRHCMKLASRHPGRESRIAEAAARFAMSGIEPTDALLSLYADAIEGKDDAEEGKGRDLLSFLNHKGGNECHWIVIPFKRSCGSRLLRGSVRFLFDTAGKTFREALITVDDQERIWDFTLDSESCFFGSNPALPPSKFRELIVYLGQQLSSYGIHTVEGGSSEARPRGEFPAVNLEI